MTTRPPTWLFDNSLVEQAIKTVKAQTRRAKLDARRHSDGSRPTRPYEYQVVGTEVLARGDVALAFAYPDTPSRWQERSHFKPNLRYADPGLCRILSRCG